MRDRDEGEFFAASLDFDDKPNEGDKKRSPINTTQPNKINLCGVEMSKLKYERKPYKR
jgi:hypothetical protein